MNSLYLSRYNSFKISSENPKFHQDNLFFEYVINVLEKEKLDVEQLRN